jgi:hypothetical protein
MATVPRFVNRPRRQYFAPDFKLLQPEKQTMDGSLKLIPLGEHRGANWPPGSAPTSMTGILVLRSLNVGLAFPWGTFMRRAKFVPYHFGERRRSAPRLGARLAARGNLASIEPAAREGSATGNVMAWQIMPWEQAQAGDRAGDTGRRLRR